MDEVFYSLLIIEGGNVVGSGTVFEVNAHARFAHAYPVEVNLGAGIICAEIRAQLLLVPLCEFLALF